MGAEITRQTAIERRQAVRRQRKIAKWGLVASLGALVLTGTIRRSPQARMAHVWAGVALLGLSYWHHTLYANDPIRE
ncbi:MAG: hypothetical protein AB1918_01110 [Pseudomonadota bacterium]